MMRGLVEKWKHPIWFHFDTTMTKKLFDDIIIKMEGNSFEIRAIVCDLGNHTLRSEFGIDKGPFSSPIHLIPAELSTFLLILLIFSSSLKPLLIYCIGGARQRVRLAVQVLSNIVAKAFTIHSQSKEATSKEKKSSSKSNRTFLSSFGRLLLRQVGQGCSESLRQDKDNDTNKIPQCIIRI
ncbi:unnamed protein product [Lepeophtheirus salmonis]|uniref:(salmon louse) hypothetical protein n=1 Tax=Lepeophtheirus salmonis TaxID=72036 RepID=A0A7R8D5X3_LEPSM|nr:unnamed protein product [Lepeophtheirus salmonis]CAF2984130.1 unnamed protein product [Lepeophtheirus salmonis]